MNKDHLIPEVRVNKLGHAVTRHVKAAPASPATKMPLPAPATAPQQNKTQQLTETVNKIDITSHLAPNRRARLSEKLETLSPDTLDLIAAAADWNASRPAPEGNFMYAVLLSSKEHTIRETAFCRPRFTDYISSFKAREIATGLHFLDRYKDTPHIEELTGTELEIATAYLNVTAALTMYVSDDCYTIHDYEDENSICINDPKLVDLIATNYQQADTIIECVKERETADPNIILEYLSNGTALKSGVL